MVNVEIGSAVGDALILTEMETVDVKSEKAVHVLPRTITPPESPHVDRENALDSLFSRSVAAKIWGVAVREVNKSKPPEQYPEYTSPDGSQYVNSSAAFWTSGFFPGCLYLLYERRRKWPGWVSSHPHTFKLQYACRWWTANLHTQASRLDTHDLGFMVQPWARLGWLIDGDSHCYRSLVTAANSLATRFNPIVGCLRSWDTCFTKRYHFADPSQNFLVIIDNLMNLDLLYYVASLTDDSRLADIATTHATATLYNHVREDGSTCHVVDFDQATGERRSQMTNQGYSDESCWSRGQAWGITGFAQAYGWSKKREFLDTSKRLADYFLAHLPEDDVPFWDFDAPKPGPRDTSAGLIAAYGMILLHEHLASDSIYLDSALRLVAAIVRMSLSSEARFVTTSSGNEDVDLGGQDTIVLNATINNYEFAPRRWADHGLVYADYYFLLIGNKLLEMGLA